MNDEQKRSPAVHRSSFPPLPLPSRGAILLECFKSHGDLFIGSALGGELREGLPFKDGLTIKAQLFVDAGELVMAIRAGVWRADDRHQQLALRFLEISFLDQLHGVDNQFIDAAPCALRRAGHLSL